jgi:valyl-tRNA synthetase
MDFILSAVFRLLHPFMPHITEELWSLLGLGEGSIQFAAPPEKVALEDADLAKKRELVSAIYEAVQAGRNLRAEGKIPSSKKTRFVLGTPGKTIAPEVPTMARLLNAEEVNLMPDYKAQPGIPVAMTALGELYLVIVGADKEAEGHRLDKEIAKVEAEVQTAQGKLKNKSFVDRAPAAVVEEHRQRLKDFSAQLAKLKQARQGLS